MEILLETTVPVYGELRSSLRLLKWKPNDYMEGKCSAEQRKKKFSFHLSLCSAKFLGCWRHGFRSTEGGQFEPGLYTQALTTYSASGKHLILFCLLFLFLFN